MRLGNLSHNLFRVAEGLTAEDQRHARTLVRISFLYVIFLLLITFALSGLIGGITDRTGMYTNVVCLIMTLTAYFISRTRHFRFGSWLVVAGILYGIGYSVTRPEISPVLSLMFLPVVILISSLTQRIEETLALSGICILGLLVFIVSRPADRPLHIVFLMVLVVASLILTFQYQRRKDLKALLYERAKGLASSRMAELGQVAGGVAHEVNNPLSIIMGSCQQAQDHLDAASELDRRLLGDRLERIERMGHRIDKIVKALRNVARREKPESKELVSALGLLKTVADLCARGLRESGNTLRWEGNLEVRLACHRVQIEQILINLVDNACDAIPGGDGTIWIKVETEPDWVSFLVSDTGPGVPDAIRENIFTPFFTTKADENGTGLGLSISAGLAKAHGGRLALEGRAPHTQFRLRLPQA